MIDFFKELLELQLKTPRIGSIRINALNSEYTHNTDQCKNCYLLANAVKNEDCFYGRDFYDNQDCVDCDHVLQCTLCYECLNCKECYNSTFLQDCANCVDCDYGYYLKDCKNCIGCAGLRKKEFYIFNEPYSREAFKEKKQKLARQFDIPITSSLLRAHGASAKPSEKSGSAGFERWLSLQFEELKLKAPRVFATQLGSENYTGDYVLHSKNMHACFDVVECQDGGYLAECKKVNDSWDIFILEDAELCYECSSNHVLHNCNFCFMCMFSSDLEYCELVANSKNCFGCVGLNHKEFHILNKPYSREDYFKRVAEIKDQLKNEGSYGRWFPSTYPIEDTVAPWPRL